jgi:tetratricopeptide (TPR) repeat protein
LEAIHEQAPYQFSLCFHLAAKKYGPKATHEQLQTIYRPVLDYSVQAMVNVANAALDRPETYEALVTRAARLAPAHYFALGDYFVGKGEDGKAAGYYQQGVDLASDAVLAANHSRWLMRYYLRQGAKDKARKIADQAGDTYSARGLVTKAVYLEETGDYAGAQEWFKKVEERYNQREELISFYERYKAKTGDTRYDAEVQARVSNAFPGGMEKVALKHFRDPPVDGVELRGDNNLTRAAGVKQGDVIVAYQGVRVHNVEQYLQIRMTSTSDQLDLIVWQAGKGYTEVRTSPPERRFGVPIKTYRQQ